MTASDPPEQLPLSHCSFPPAIDPLATRDDGISKSSRTVRFLQASDFRLDTPCHGVLDLPEDLRDRFVDARYIAAQRVFDAAIESSVDFLILPGGLLDAGLPGLRGPWFLTEQFGRLADQGIQVYWAGSTFETRGRWPVHVRIPENVHRLASDATVLAHRKDGRRAVSLLSVPPHQIATLPVINDGAFVIAVQPRSTQVPERWDAGIDFWALGGQSHHETEQVGKVIAHFAGSPQGRSPAESGRHSCSLVDVDSEGGVHIEPIATNVVRWHHEHVTLEASSSWSDVEEQLFHRQTEIRVDPAAELVMVHWTITGSGLALQRLLEPAYNRQLLSRLNAQRSIQNPTFWTTRIEAIVEMPEVIDGQGTVATLGAFLRELRELGGHVEEMIGDAPAGDRPGRKGDSEASQQMMQHVINEGVHRLAERVSRSPRAGRSRFPPTLQTHRGACGDSTDHMSRSGAIDR